MAARVLNDELKLIASPKSGQTYLSHVCRGNGTSTYKGYDDDHFVLFVVRHPMDRLVSTWAFFASHEVFDRRQFPAYFHQDGSPPTFEEFCEKRITEGVFEGHLRPQIDHLKYCMHVDYFCALEDFDDALFILEEEFPDIKFDTNAAPHNQSTRDQDWRPYFKDDGMLRKLEQEHSHDFVLYNLAKNNTLSLKEAIAKWRK